MSILARDLQLDTRLDALTTRCLALIEQQVDRRGLVRRLALKTALKAVETIKPGALRQAVERLLPHFAAALDPLYRQFLDANLPEFSPFLIRHSDGATAALLAVADARVAGSRDSLRRAYARLRPDAEAEVRAALPALGALIDQARDTSGRSSTAQKTPRA